MLQEIEVEGLGVMRHLNNWQLARVKRISDRRNRFLAMAAFGLGMTVRQFSKLSPGQQSAAWEAFNRLTAPAPIEPRHSAQRPSLPRPGEHVPIAKQIEIGRQLLQMKERLPHGHFQPWVEDKSGLSYTQAQRFMRAAREATRCCHHGNAFRDAAE